MRHCAFKYLFSSSGRLKLSLGLLIAVALAACGGDNDSTSIAKTAPALPSATSSPPQTNSSPPASPVNWPADHAIVDPNRYAAAQDADAMNSVSYRSGPNGGAGDTKDDVASASLDLKSVDETPSAKHHQMTANGKTIEYTASAGHLIAWTPKDSANPTKKDAKASVFYMAYTRDDLPKDKRPVTFVFNGGPGEPSIWLHLGSWAPKRLTVGAPKVPDGPNMPDSYPLVDNDQTLLDQTDLVYVDIVGSGYSEAIAPHKNRDFWSTDADAEVFRDFITAYINRNNRQSSPKYLMGESYSGIRTPILADLLVKAGTRDYAHDPTGKKPIVLSGMVLQSPILDYGYVATKGDGALGSFPTVAEVADFFGKSSVRGAQSKDEYAFRLRRFVTDKLAPSINSTGNTPNSLALELNGIGGWSVNDLTSQPLDLGNFNFHSIGTQLYPTDTSVSFNDYDGRMLKTGKFNFNLSFYEDAAFYGAIKPLLVEQFNYKNANEVQLYGSDVAFSYWVHGHRGESRSRSVLDLVETLVYAPDVKVLVLHGYDDSVTPFFQTELDLAYVGLLDLTNPGKDGRVVVKEDDGGHMEYLTESSRTSMRANLNVLYGA